MTAAQPISPAHARTLITERLGQPRPPAVNLAETLVRLGRLDAEGVERVEAGRAGAPFGKTAVRLGLISKADLEYGLGVHLGFLHDSDERVRIPAPLTIVRNPYSRTADEFRALRTRLVAGAEKDALSRIAVTAADNSADGAYVALNLAAAFAQLGRKTLLVDANLQRPALARIFGASHAPGLSDVVCGRCCFASAVSQTLVRNLDLLAAGAREPDPQRILADDRFRAAMTQAGNAYAVTLILTAPFGIGGDSELAWAGAKSILVAAKKDETRSATLEAMRKAARRADSGILAAVLAE